MTDGIPHLLALALTGESLPLPEVYTGPDAFLDALDDAGWPIDAVCAHAQRTWESQEPWPHPVDLRSSPGVGAAQWYAAFTAVRSALGLDVVQQPPSRRTALTSDERRLLHDVPPHHGPVG